MRCNQCGNECSDSASFCNQCGAKLTDQTKQIQPGQQVPVQQVPVQQVPVQQAPKKKSKLPIIILSALFLVVVGAGVMVFGKSLIKSDYDKFMDASLKTQEAKQIEMVGEFGFDEFNYQSEDPVEKALIENIIKGAKIQFGMQSDMASQEIDGTLAFNLSGSQLFDVGIHMNKEYVAISAPKLYSKMIYMNWDDFRDILLKYDLVTEDDISDIDIIRMLELVDAYKKAVDYKSFDSYKKFDKKPYESIVQEYESMLIKEVKNGKMDLEVSGETYSFSGKIYTMDLEMDKYMDLFVKLVEIAVADDAILPMITEGANRVIDTTIKEQDYYVYNMLASANGNETVTEWDKDLEKELITMKEDMIDSMTEGYDQSMSDIEDVMSEDSFVASLDALKEVYSEMDYSTQYIVEKGYVRGVETKIHVDDSIVDALNDLEAITGDPTGMTNGSLDGVDVFFDITMYLRVAYKSVDEKIEFAVLPKDSVDFSTLTEDELMEMYQEMMMNAQKLSQSFSGL